MTNLEIAIAVLEAYRETGEVNGKPVKFNMRIWLIEEDCRTAACAAGVLILSGRVPGLYFDRNSPRYEDAESYAALVAALEISLDLAVRAFRPGPYDHPQTLDNVITRLKEGLM